MAFLHFDNSAATTGHGFRDRVSGLLAGIKAGFEAYAERRGRFDEIARLQAMSDEELAARGIQRDMIVHHVFRDKFHF